MEHLAKAAKDHCHSDHAAARRVSYYIDVADRLRVVGSIFAFLTHATDILFALGTHQRSEDVLLRGLYYILDDLALTVQETAVFAYYLYTIHDAEKRAERPLPMTRERTAHVIVGTMALVVGGADVEAEPGDAYDLYQEVFGDIFTVTERIAIDLELMDILGAAMNDRERFLAFLESISAPK